MAEVTLDLEELFAILADLPVAPVLDQAVAVGPAIDARRASRTRACAFGDDERAQAAIYLGESPAIYGRPRWLDACWPHYIALRHLVHNWPGDTELLVRYRAWVTRQGETDWAELT